MARFAVVACEAVQTADLSMPALAANQMTIIVAKCKSGNAKVPVIDKTLSLPSTGMRAVEA